MTRAFRMIVLAAVAAGLVAVSLVTGPDAQTSTGTVNLRTPVKGATAAGTLTSQNVDADTQALHVNLKGTNSLTVSSGTITSNQGTAAAQTNRWPVFVSDGTAERVGQQTMANSLPVAIASNQGNIGTLTPLTAIVTGQQAVTASAVALPANASRRICVKVLIGGTQTVYFGPSGVTTGTGQELSPGDAWCGPASNTNLIFVIAAGTGSTVAYDALN